MLMGRLRRFIFLIKIVFLLFLAILSRRVGTHKIERILSSICGLFLDDCGFG
jgi:hypothetical protein